MALNFGKLNFSVSFNPTSAFPLDARCYFESYEAAQAAAQTAMPAGDSTTVYYYGMTLCVVEDGTATLYIIQPNKTLSKVGNSIAYDEKAFLINNEDKLSLVGFADAVAGAQLIKGADGNLQWVKPDTTTVEGLATEVAGLRKDVTSLQGTVGNGESGLVKDVSDLKTSNTSLLERLSTIETGLSDRYTKGETDSAIATAVANAEHLKRKIVEDLPEPTAADRNTIYMKLNGSGSGQNIYEEYMVINEKWELIGSTAVDLSNYVTNETLIESLASKVDAVPGSRLMTEAEGTKLASIQEGAEKNVIATVAKELSISEGRELSILAIEQSKVTGLPEALLDKVSKSELANYVTTETANATYATKESLNDKVDKEKGKGLSTNDYTTEDKQKLTGIATGAQVNIIESIAINGIDVPAQEKKVNLPLATAISVGLVKGAEEDNKIKILGDGTMEVNSISISKIKQLESEELIINGGSSKL